MVYTVYQDLDPPIIIEKLEYVKLTNFDSAKRKNICRKHHRKKKKKKNSNFELNRIWFYGDDDPNERLPHSFSLH